MYYLPVWIFLLFFFLIPFIPLRFHITYENRGIDDLLSLEMSFLRIFRWRRRVTLIKPRLEHWGLILSGEQEQKLPLMEQEKKEHSYWQIDEVMKSLQNLIQGLEKYGLGATLLSLFLPKKVRSYLTVIGELENKGHFKKFEWKTSIGTGNPAQTAILLGTAWGVVGYFLAVLQNRYRFRCQPLLNVTPSFGQKVLDTCFDCIFELKIGHIMLAGFKELGRRWITDEKGG